MHICLAGSVSSDASLVCCVCRVTMQINQWLVGASTVCYSCRHPLSSY